MMIDGIETGLSVPLVRYTWQRPTAGTTQTYEIKVTPTSLLVFLGVAIGSAWLVFMWRNMKWSGINIGAYISSVWSSVWDYFLQLAALFSPTELLSTTWDNLTGKVTNVPAQIIDAILPGATTGEVDADKVPTWVKVASALWPF